MSTNLVLAFEIPELHLTKSQSLLFMIKLATNLERPNYTCTEIITHLIVIVEDLDDVDLNGKRGENSCNIDHNLLPRNRLSHTEAISISI